MFPSYHFEQDTDALFCSPWFQADVLDQRDVLSLCAIRLLFMLEHVGVPHQDEVACGLALGEGVSLFYTSAIISNPDI